MERKENSNGKKGEKRVSEQAQDSVRPTLLLASGALGATMEKKGGGKRVAQDYERAAKEKGEAPFMSSCGRFPRPYAKKWPGREGAKDRANSDFVSFSTKAEEKRPGERPKALWDVPKGESSATVEKLNQKEKERKKKPNTGGGAGQTSIKQGWGHTSSKKGCSGGNTTSRKTGKAPKPVQLGDADTKNR